MSANATRPPAGPDRAIGHEVLAAVLRVRDGALQVLLWQRALPPAAGRWALPGGRLGEEDVAAAVRRHLAAKVDVSQLSHLEQLAVFSDPHRVPGRRVVATAFLGLVPGDADPAVPGDTRWHAADRLPEMAFDHRAITGYGRDRLRAKLCYTNLGFALAPAEFTVSGLRGYPSLPGAINPPVFAPTEFELAYHQTFGGLVDLTFTCGLFTSKGDTDAGRKALLGFLAPSGSGSVLAALETDKTLGGVCKTLIVRRVRGAYRLYEIGGTEYLGALVDVEVWA